MSRTAAKKIPSVYITAAGRLREAANVPLMSELPHRFEIRRAAAWRQRRVRRPASPESNRFFLKPPVLAPADRAGFQVVDSVSDPAQRIRRDFAVLPGLALTFGQARRLWALPEDACQELLEALVAEGFLWVRSDSRYVRRSGTSPGSGVPT
jgi:hypothetical protein